ncbi:MAG: DUF4434 domain-containing protein [Thermoguttaceae bacterium]
MLGSRYSGIAVRRSHHVVLLAILLGSVLVAASRVWAAPASPSRPIRPITGTWLNLFYEDVRYTYTNPKQIDLIRPEAWPIKIRELSELGVKRLILLAVVNDGKAWYESDFLPRVFHDGQESPVSAIMNAADRHGMDVFMSCGWGTTQAADPTKPDIQDLQLKIMRETAKRFSGHKSFFGWYFPCEFSAAPNISDPSIEWVNRFSAEARRLTPKAKILISPFFAHKAVADDKYVAQLKKLDVDIIAYQDSVGCVFTTQPEIKRQFAKLRWAHDQVPRIALWGNVETFTWPGGCYYPDYSPLIPGAFPRILSQMTGASPYVDETISYTVQGMMDKPGSPLPVGEPVWSARLAQDYLDYRVGRGRWPLLAASFENRLTHEAIGRAVKLATPPATQYNHGNLTDGRFGDEEYGSRQWLGFDQSDLDATIDLGRPTPIKTLAARFLQYARAGIRVPKRVEFSISDDGQTFRPAGGVAMDAWPHDRYDYWIDMAVADGVKETARYVRVHAVNAGGWLFADELLVNPTSGAAPMK